MATDDTTTPLTDRLSRLVRFVTRAHFLVTIAIATLAAVLLIAFPRPSMTDHYNSFLHRGVRDIIRTVSFPMLVLAAIIGCHPRARSSVAFWVSVVMCFLGWLFR